MKVYVLNEIADYEGESTLGVYSSREKAEAAWAAYDGFEKEDDHGVIHEREVDAPAEWVFTPSP